MVKNLLCIIGETARGKDTVARYLQQQYNLKGVVSYTNRPKRINETDGVDHYFVTDEQASEILKKEPIYAFTKIGAYIYFATKKEVEASDFYIIDPVGYRALIKQKLNQVPIIIYVTCNQEIAEVRFKSRGGTEQEYIARANAEHAQFTEFKENGIYNFYINNNNTIQELFNQVDDIMHKLS